MLETILRGLVIAQVGDFMTVLGILDHSQDIGLQILIVPITHQVLFADLLVSNPGYQNVTPNIPLKRTAIHAAL